MFTTTTTNLLNVSTYESGLFSINDYLDRQAEIFDTDLNDFDFDCNLYGKAIVEAFGNAYYNNKIEGIDLIPVKFSCPQFYNFSDDKIVLDVILSDEMKAKFDQLALTSEFQAYLTENYTSGPGFMSFVPTDLTEFLASSYKMKVLLDYYILETWENGKEWVENMENSMLDYINGNYSYSDFETDKENVNA
jgi:hypothetical protein